MKAILSWVITIVVVTIIVVAGRCITMASYNDGIRDIDVTIDISGSTTSTTIIH